MILILSVQYLDHAIDHDHIDYVAGIDLQEKPQKCTNKSQKMAKNDAFLEHFWQYLPNRNTWKLKLGYPSGQGLLPTDEKLLCSVSEVF